MANGVLGRASQWTVCRTGPILVQEGRYHILHRICLQCSMVLAQRGLALATPGVVYTKDWVVDFVLDIAGYDTNLDLSAYCVVEPACGDGAFLKKIVERLCESVSRRSQLDEKSLRGCIRAYDLDPQSVAASRAAVIKALKHCGVSSSDSLRLATEWVIQGDFLLLDIPSAHWVVGNPPYVRASLISRERREIYKEKLSTVTMGSDVYVGFFEKGLRALDEDGSLCYICSDRWLQNRYGSRLRSFVSQGYSLDVHVRMHGVDAFEDDVSAYPAISLIRKGLGRGIRYMECSPHFSEKDVSAVKAWIDGKGDNAGSDAGSADLLPPLAGSHPIPLASPDKLRVLGDIAGRYPLLEDAGVRLGIGVASGCDEVYIIEDPSMVESERLLPLFFMRDWRAGNRDGSKWLVDPWDESGSLVDLDSYPKLKGYFKSNASKLKARRVARDHPDAWYRTLDKPNHSLMGQEMLLFPDMAARSEPVYSDGSRYPHHNCYWVVSSEWNVRALGGLLMSDLVESYVDAFGVKMRGSTLRFQAQYLRMIHIPHASEVDGGTMDELATAFDEGDREKANRASRRAYGLEADHAR